MRPVGVARHQHLLPWRQSRIALAQQAVRLGFEPADLLGDVEPAVRREVAQLFDLAFEFGDRPFEIEEMAHWRDGRSLAPGERMRGLDQPAQTLALYMGVDLCRRDISMAEHLLHASQIGSMIE